MKTIITAIAISVAATGVFAQTKGGDANISATGACPTNATVLSAYPGTVLGCSCPPNGSAGAVWGSGPYTSDSDLCAAARHNGIIGSEGGMVWARIGGAQGSYAGSSSNGVETLSYGQYDSSFDFVSTLTMVSEAVEQCPENMVDQPATLTCNCGADYTTMGSIWGTGLYTYDSRICRAAVHAGVIQEGVGGVVTIVQQPGASEYQGSTQNGVTSSGYGPWQGSYVFR